ncbi:voltage-dependent calcium channel gamma-6 subunit-like [Narcine bancroftii]|uniref:voltage-dependent calcium channel gamma-6 subunit-like n=1 Tax=Narcine bancroftii TaxID=1343680 RepID=UPI003831E4FA
MWPSFFPGTEEERGARPGRVRRAQEEGKEGARRLSLLLGLAGLVLMVTAAGSDFWAELKGQAGAHNFTCQAAHFGLWRQCVKTIEVQELEPGAGLCGPVELPGVSNCSYFRFFMTGEKTYIVDREAPKELFVLVAVFTVLCLCLMTMGSISISTSPRNHRRFLLNLSATFYITADPWTPPRLPLRPLDRSRTPGSLSDPWIPLGPLDPSWTPGSPRTPGPPSDLGTASRIPGTASRIPVTASRTPGLPLGHLDSPLGSQAAPIRTPVSPSDPQTPSSGPQSPHWVPGLYHKTPRHPPWDPGLPPWTHSLPSLTPVLPPD